MSSSTRTCLTQSGASCFLTFAGGPARRAVGRLKQRLGQKGCWARTTLLKRALVGEPTFCLGSVPKASWEESWEDYAARLKQVVEGINNHHDVDALCRSFPTRLQK